MQKNKLLNFVAYGIPPESYGIEDVLVHLKQNFSLVYWKTERIEGKDMVISIVHVQRGSTYSLDALLGFTDMGITLKPFYPIGRRSLERSDILETEGEVLFVVADTMGSTLTIKVGDKDGPYDNLSEISEKNEMNMA